MLKGKRYKIFDNINLNSLGQNIYAVLMQFQSNIFANSYFLISDTQLSAWADISFTAQGA